MNPNLDSATATAPAAALDRRAFLRLSAMAGGGFMLGYTFLKTADRALAAEAAGAAPATATVFSPSNYLRVAADGTVTIYSARPEMGQGIKTSLPMIIAEELDLNWKDVKVINSSIDPGSAAPAPQAAGNPAAVPGGGARGGGGRGGRGGGAPNLDGPAPQQAGGSTSTPTSFGPMQTIGATARAVFIAAAAQTWGVGAEECSTANSTVLHAASGRKLPYGQLVALAATLPVPANVTPKNPKDYKLLGTRVSGVDNPDIVKGKPLFGIDVKVPGMVYAVYEKNPVYGGGGVVSANTDEVKKLPGVKDVLVIEATNGVPAGVAILADSTWSALSAREQLKVVWNEGTRGNDSWATMTAQAQTLGAQAGAQDGDAFLVATKVVEATYSFPYISHANLEPQNCTASVKDGQVELWVPTQNPGSAQQLAATATGIGQNNIKVHVTRSGGGFGRRLTADFAGEAALISQRAGVPVKLQWSREDDMHHDLFRPAGFNFLKGGVDATGKLVAWRDYSVAFNGGGGGGRGRGGAALLSPESGGAGIFAQAAPARGGPRGAGGGGAFPGNGFVTGYNARQGTVSSGVPTGAWRAPGDCTAMWVVQSFLDELAHAGGREPLEFKLEVLSHAQNTYSQRTIPVVKLAAEKIGWGKTLPRGQGLGIAFSFSHQGYVAHAVQVTVTKLGALTVDHVVSAVDVGRVIVNLSGAENQVEGSVVDALSTLMFPELDLKKGRMVQSNFDEYQLLRMPDAPKKIEVNFIKSDNNPTGLGEPAFSALAPAVCNAIFAATGIRVRQLPLSRTSLKWS